MLRFIIMVLAIMLLAALVGADCLTCGQGDNIRQNISKIFGK